jgi:nitrogen-specific signal transduction histidine kinase
MRRSRWTTRAGTPDGRASRAHPQGRHPGQGSRAADILAFSRQAGPEERLPVKVAPIVEEAVKLLRALLPASVDISSDIDANTGMVLADSAQVHQLVMNLCNNAYQALDAHGGSCTSR